MLGRVMRRLRVPDPDPAVVAQGLGQPDDAAVLRPPPQGHVSVQVLCVRHAPVTRLPGCGFGAWLCFRFLAQGNVLSFHQLTRP